MEFLPITKNKGIYYNADYQPEKMNLSAALAEFCPTLESLVDLKDTMIENMHHSVTEIKKESPSMGLTQDEFLAWYKETFEVGHKPMLESTYVIYMEIVQDLTKYKIEQATAEPRRVIRRVNQKIVHLQQPAKAMSGVTEQQIEEAREYPLEDMITNKRFKATGKWRSNYHCPLEAHKGEKTPSFYVDTKNRYKCFGCQERGDAIDFVIQRDGVDFIRAVKSLIR